MRIRIFVICSVLSWAFSYSIDIELAHSLRQYTKTDKTASKRIPKYQNLYVQWRYSRRKKDIRWDGLKNEKLKSERDVSFEGVLVAIQQGNTLDDLIHPNQEKYPNQRLLVVKIKGYAYLIPYVETDTEIFLKTIIPSRKATKEYLSGGNSNE